MSVQGNPRLQFPSTNTVFVGIMSVHFHDIERGIRIVFPAAAEVKDIIDAPDTPGAGDTQSQSIIFSIACIRKVDPPEHRCIKGTGSSQTVDAERIVTSVFKRPLPMVDDAGRYFVHLEIGHPIGSDNHRAVLFIKSINDLLQRIRTAIYIVAIELDGKLATSRMMHTHVPATPPPPPPPRRSPDRNVPEPNEPHVRLQYIFRLLRKFRLSNGYPQ